MKIAIGVIGVLLALLAATAIYALRPVEVQTGFVRTCTDSRHKGDRVVLRQFTTQRMPYWQSGGLSVKQEQDICQPCSERNVRGERLAREKAEKERREAEERAERERQEVADRAERERQAGQRRVMSENVLGVWEAHVGLGSSQWAFNRDGTGHTVNFSGSFNIRWSIEGNRLHVIGNGQDVRMPFEVTARTLTLHMPDGALTFTRVE